jgi:glucose-1-phosphate thymidylyltransferase
VENFRRQERGGRILLKQMENPEHLSHLGVPIMEGGRVRYIREKPETPPSPYAVIGVYMYDGMVFDIIKTLKPSGRGELEITDVNNAYIQREEMTWEELDGWWTDAGTFESLLRASNMVAETGANKMNLLPDAEATAKV